MNRTAIVADRAFMNHSPGRHHPERPERIAAMIEMTDHLQRDNLKFHSPREATPDELELCHTPEYVEAVDRTEGLDRFDFDPDTHTSPETARVARLATGGVITAVEAVLDGDADNAFAIVRPPGHHARPGQAMGFCFFNNVAIAARWLVARHNLERVMVLDWDVHHGNGTQEIFFGSPEVLYISTHQYPFYPGTGWLDEIGTGPGAGFTVNAPFPAGFGDTEYLTTLDDLILPVARQFRPEFVLISAGFDCHHRDPLGGMRVSDNGFLAMTRRMKRLAAECCEGRLVAVLEGGYDLQGLAEGGRAVIEELGRNADEHIDTNSRSARVAPIVDRARHFLAPYWKID
ncbi:MAG TPA: histone deacetylase [Candidatus Binataceae bacterium]|nr:histone deacetylase [Candidatus Binataceae bacterium]